MLQQDQRIYPLRDFVSRWIAPQSLEGQARRNALSADGKGVEGYEARLSCSSGKAKLQSLRHVVAPIILVACYSNFFCWEPLGLAAQRVIQTTHLRLTSPSPFRRLQP